MSDMSSIYIPPGGGQILCLFDHYTSVGNVGTTETDLYSDTIVANTLATNGDKLEFMYSGTFDTSSTKRLKVYIGINVLLDSAAINHDAGYWTASGTIIRRSINVIRSTVKCDMYDAIGSCNIAGSHKNCLIRLTCGVEHKQYQSYVPLPVHQIDLIVTW